MTPEAETEEDMFKDLPKGGDTPLSEYMDYLKKKWSKPESPTEAEE